MSPPAAVLLDALGTLVALEPPAGPLRDALRERCGLDVDEATATAALAAEIAYYRAHHAEGRDDASLADLRRGCAAVLRDAVGLPAAAIALPDVEAALLSALRFRAYPEAEAVLGALRGAGRTLVVVSNWDRSLHGVLAQTGLAGLLDGVLTSAEAGASKPDPAIFARALAIAGVEAAAALHVGDSWSADVQGARAAGIAAVHLVRHEPGGGGGGGGGGVGGGTGAEGVATIASLRELVALAT